MKNLIKQNLATLMVTVFALSFFVGSVNVVAAADLGSFDDYGGFDYGYDDYGGYDYSYDDYGGFDYGYDDYGGFDYSYDDYGGFDYGNSYYEESGYFPYEYSYEEGGYFPYEYEYDYGGYDYDYYTPSYSYGGGSYDYGCGSYCGTGGGSFDWGCGSWCGSGGGNYSIPRYTTPSSSYNNVVTNTNTNVNNITNIDNSIRDSFNNYNSGNTSIVVTAPQTPVQTPAPYCTITHAQYGGYGSGAYLSWTSTNASSAYLSNVGSVAVSGFQTVYPQGSQTYTLTVHGYNGQTATCATSVHGQTYVPPTYHPPVYSQPYVSLTQIPYTGFDFGPIGNAMYWVSLLGFAAAGAYLMVYYRGGALAFATAMVPARSQKFQPVVAPKAPIMIEREALAAAHAEAKVQPIIASLRKAAGTLDTMAIVASKDGSMPRIVIQRA